MFDNSKEWIDFWKKGFESELLFKTVFEYLNNSVIKLKDEEKSTDKLYTLISMDITLTKILMETIKNCYSIFGDNYSDILKKLEKIDEVEAPGDKYDLIKKTFKVLRKKAKVEKNRKSMDNLKPEHLIKKEEKKEIILKKEKIIFGRKIISKIREFFNKKYKTFQKKN